MTLIAFYPPPHLLLGGGHTSEMQLDSSSQCAVHPEDPNPQLIFKKSGCMKAHSALEAPAPRSHEAHWCPSVVLYIAATRCKAVALCAPKCPMCHLFSPLPRPWQPPICFPSSFSVFYPNLTSSTGSCPPGWGIFYKPALGAAQEPPTTVSHVFSLHSQTSCLSSA